MDSIDLVDLHLDCILGVLDSEQRRVQPLRGELRMWVDLDEAGVSGNLAKTVNYADVAGWLTHLTEYGRFRLLESIGVAALRLILLPPAPGEERVGVPRARLVLRKPTILGELATPGVSVEREASWAPVPRRAVVEGVDEEVLVDTGRSMASRVRFAADAAWEVPADFAVYVISGRLTLDKGLSIGPNTALPPGEAGTVRASDAGASVLVVRVPPPPEET